MWEYQGTEAGLHVVEAWEGHALPPRYRHYWTTLTKAKNDRPRSVSLLASRHPSDRCVAGRVPL